MDSETTKNRIMCFSQKETNRCQYNVAFFLFFHVCLRKSSSMGPISYVLCNLGEAWEGQCGCRRGGGEENSYMNHAFSRGCLMHLHDVLYQASISATNYGSIKNQLAQSTRKIIIIIKKVSIHVSLRSPRRLTWADTFCKCRRPLFRRE